MLNNKRKCVIHEIRDVKSLVTRREEKITVLPNFKGWSSTALSRNLRSKIDKLCINRRQVQNTGHRSQVTGRKAENRRKEVRDVAREGVQSNPLLLLVFI